MEDMGKESVNMSNFHKESIKVVKFSKEMEEAEKDSFHNERRKFKDFFAKKPKSLLEPLDWMGNTALHVATRANDPNLLRGLLNMIEKDQQRFEALSMKNTRCNTVLHHAIHSKNVEMLDVLIGYKDLRLRSPKEIGASVEEDERKLLEQQNGLRETPGPCL